MLPVARRAVAVACWEECWEELENPLLSGGQLALKMFLQQRVDFRARQGLVQARWGSRVSRSRSRARC